MKKLLDGVLTQIVPSSRQLADEKKISNELIAKIKKVKGQHLKALVLGSVGRNTHLANDRDIDIFILFPEKLSRDKFESEGLRIAKTVLKGHPWQEAYSEHPYLKGQYKGFDVELIPAYRVSSATAKQSAVDRTPFHQAYLQKRLTNKQKNEVRLLKQFLRGIHAYGADVKNEGLAGYATELLILKYKTFAKTIANTAKWTKPIVIDLAKHWKAAQALAKFPKNSLVLIDPTDSQRNVAAAFSDESFEQLVHESKRFQKKPSNEFFFPKPIQPKTPKELQSAWKKTNTLGIAFDYPNKALSDVVWGQLKRLSKQLHQSLEQDGFEIEKSTPWTDEKQTGTVLIRFEKLQLAATQKRIGPLLTDAKNVQRFLSAHKNAKRKKTENGHIILETARKIQSAEQGLKQELDKIAKTAKPPLGPQLQKTGKVLDSDKIAKFSENKTDFRAFATQFIQQKKGANP